RCHHKVRGPAELQCLPAGSCTQVCNDCILWNRCVLSNKSGSWILNEKQSLTKRAKLGKRNPAGDLNAVARQWRILDFDSRSLEHRLELLTHNSVRPDHDGGFCIVLHQKHCRSFLAVSLEPACDDPSRMRVSHSESFDWISRRWNRKIRALTIDSSQHRIDELARTDAMT